MPDSSLIATDPSDRSTTAIVSILLAAALLLAGGGWRAPFTEMIIELAAALLIAVWVWRSAAWRRVPPRVWLIIALVASVPLVQLIPLPPQLWHSMPGRELQREALALIGQENAWQSWSIAPDRTLVSLLALGPPLAILAMTSAIPRARRVALLAVISLAAIVSLIVGAAQLAGGSDSPFRLPGSSDLVLTGLLANRNHTADLFLVALVAIPALIVDLVRDNRFPPSRAFVLWASAGAMVLCTLGVVLTSSRTGIALLPVAMFAAALVLNTWLRLSWRQLALGGIVAIAGLALGAWLLWNQTSIAHASSRFVIDRELRPELWRDTIYAARQFFPFGVGMGNFTPAILAGERLEVVRETLPNQAHNDFLELLLEAGVFGVAALAAVTFLIFGSARRLLGTRRPSHSQAVFALSGLILIAAHSVVDYPVRTMAMTCLVAACVGMLMAARQDQAAEPRSGQTWE